MDDKFTTEKIFLICKKCGSTIEDDLCSYECPDDTEWLADRTKDKTVTSRKYKVTYELLEEKDYE